MMQWHPHTVQTHTATPLGMVWLAASTQGLCGLWFDGQRHFPAPLLSWPAAPAHPVLLQAQAQLQQYLSGTRTGFDLPLDMSGASAFQQTVWQALQSIAWGQTLSYSALAHRLGRPQAVRAVATAVGHNPLSIIVPCHRVLGKNASLTGYAGGLERKAALLTLEAGHPP